MARLRTRQRNDSGFTIIEVIIVLAIAGFILALVLAAIPTLNRNSRNNQRRQDVSLILQDVSRYQLNNSANFPPDNTFLKNAPLTFYSTTTAGQITITPQDSVSAHTFAGHTNPDTVEVTDYAKCLADNSGGTQTTGADYTDIVGLYALETAGGSIPKCEQL